MEQTFLSHRPAVRMVLLLAAGILLAQVLAPPPILCFILLVLAVLTSCAFALRKSPGVPVVLHGAVFLLGLSLQALERKETESRALLSDVVGKSVRFEGFVDAEPVGGGTRVRFIVWTGKVEAARGVLKGGNRILVETKAEWVGSLLVGSGVRISGIAGALPGARNPGEFDAGRYFRLKGVSGIVTVEDQEGIVLLLKDSRMSLWSIMASVRRTLAKAIDSFHGDVEGAYLKGLLLAERGNIPFEVKRSFIDTGTIHILAVSGLHVALVAVLFYTVFGLFRMPGWLAAILTMLGLVGYMVLTGATASVVRATIMACVVLCGKLLQRRTDIYQSLAVSACIILLIDPNQLFDVGFQLSYAAVISIVYFYPSLEKLIHRIPERFEEVKALDQVLKLFAVSLAAQLGTLPFTAFYFERVSIVALAANLIAVPVSSLNLMIGFATLASSFISDWLAGTFAAVNDLLVSFLLGFVGKAGGVPFATVHTAGLPEVFPFFYYAGLAGVFSVHRWDLFKKLFLTTLAGLTLMLYIGLFGQERANMRVTVLDVGQGDAILIRFPGGRHLLVDAGPKSMSYDAGERVVAPFLRRMAIRRLDGVVISHPHSDHLGGVEHVIREFDVGTIYEASGASVSRMHGNLRGAMESEHIEGTRVRAGESIELDLGARIYLLNPTNGRDHPTNLNNSSVVMKILFGSTSILLAGDAEEEAEKKLVKRFRDFLDSDILKVGHHGSSTSSTDEFLNSITPDIAIISVGIRNKFRHPSPAVVAKLEAGGAEVYRTDLDGAIILESDGHHFRRMQWRSPLDNL